MSFISNAINTTRGLAFRAKRRLLSPQRLVQMVVLGMRIFSAGLGYLILALSARALNTNGFSDFAIILATAGLFGPIAVLGQDSLLLRQLPISCAHHYQGYRDILRKSAAIALPGITAFAMGALLYGYIALSTSSTLLLALLALLVAANGTVEFLFGAQRGSGSVLGAVFNRELAWKLVLFVPLVAAVLFHMSLSVTAIAAWYLAGLVLAAVFALAYLRRHWTNAAKAPADAAYSFPEVNRRSLFLITLINQAGTQIDIVILGAVTAINSVELGAFFAAQRTIQILYILPYGASMTSAARLAPAWSRGDIKEIAHLSRQISRGTGALVLVIAVLLTVFRVETMTLFRPEFATFAAVLPVLCIGPVASSLGGLHNVIPAMCGMETEYSRLRMSITAIFTIAKVLAAWQGSLVTFAVLTACEAVVTTIAGTILVRRRLGVWTV